MTLIQIRNITSFIPPQKEESIKFSSVKLSLTTHNQKNNFFAVVGISPKPTVAVVVYAGQASSVAYQQPAADCNYLNLKHFIGLQ